MGMTIKLTGGAFYSVKKAESKPFGPEPDHAGVGSVRG